MKPGSDLTGWHPRLGHAERMTNGSEGGQRCWSDHEIQVLPRIFYHYPHPDHAGKESVKDRG